MKICIFGTGAIGGLLAARLAPTSAEVTCIARGATLEALNRKGLTLISGERETTLPIHGSDKPAEIGPQDYLILTLKAHQIPSIVNDLTPLLGPETSIITAHNGIPFWYFYGQKGQWKDHHLTSVDPGGQVWRTLDPARAIGAVVFPAAQVMAPGVVRHLAGEGLTLGEPAGVPSLRLNKLADLLRDAQFEVKVSSDIRKDLWMKLSSNVAVNGVSVLTRATLVDMIEDRSTRKILRNVICETKNIAESLNCPVDIDPDQLLDAIAKMGAHKTSMLQDFEAEKCLEIDPIIGAVAELGELTQTPYPTLQTILALLRLRVGQAQSGGEVSG